MKKFILALCLITSTLAPSFAQAQPAPFFFRDGDRAVLLGDSITERHQYTTLIESYVLSRFPTWNISFRNAGWGGDRADFRQRGKLPIGMARDILPMRPTAITVNFGMNDARDGAGRAGAFAANTYMLVKALEDAGARVALLTPSSEERYEADQPAGSAYNETLRAYAQELNVVASAKKLPFVDQLNPMIATIEAGRATGVLSKTESDARLIPDGVHPNWAGHMVMATHILKGLNAPTLVSRVEIDAKSGEVKTEKAAVKEVKTGETVSFARLDEALPWPLHPDAALALKIPGFNPLDELSRYELRVLNLRAPQYEVAIDSETVGVFSREALAKGVNFSAHCGPIEKQKQDLLQAITAKNAIYFERWRKVERADLPEWLVDGEGQRNAYLAQLDAKIAVEQAKVEKLRQPQSHRWTLKPAPI